MIFEYFRKRREAQAKELQQRRDNNYNTGYLKGWEEIQSGGLTAEEIESWGYRMETSDWEDGHWDALIDLRRLGVIDFNEPYAISRRYTPIRKGPSPRIAMRCQYSKNNCRAKTRYA